MDRDFIPFARPDVGRAEADAVAKSILSGWVTSGPGMREFEHEFVEYLGGGVEAVAVNSCTAALHLALEALGVGPSDEVIVPTWTFTATAEVVRYLGATPVIVDIEPDTLSMSLAAVAEALTARTKAVVPVHFAGLPMDVVGLRRVVGPGVAILEDAAHCIPAVGNDGVVGTCGVSDAAAFSFYATKTMTTGEGGMLTTGRPEVAARARVMRLHGIDRDAFDRYSSTRPSWAYDVIAPGYKYNLPDTAAAMGRVQLARAEGMHRRRCAIAAHYLETLSDLPLELPPGPPTAQVHSWHLFVIRLAPTVDRDAFIEAMSVAGIGTSVHFIPLHQHSYWRQFTDPAAFPVATELAPRVVSLPISSSLTDSQVERVTQAVRQLIR